MVDGESRAILLGFLPGPRTRRRGSSYFERRFRMVPSARWQRVAASRTVYQRSTSPGNCVIILIGCGSTQLLCQRSRVNAREDLGGQPIRMITQLPGDVERWY